MDLSDTVDLYLMASADGLHCVQFLGLLAAEGLQAGFMDLRKPGPDRGDGVPVVLYLGADCAVERETLGAALAGSSAQLLISDDPSVLAWPELARFGGQLLVAPYDESTLRREVGDCLRWSREESKQAALVALNIMGGSAAMRRLLQGIVRIARFDAPVLIEGETGTGKELVARSIHYSSSRLDGPFVPVNCGALTDELMVSELFGHEKGAFTDARRAHPGLVAQAAGGTLFLDEVDNLSPRGQAALLRFMQEKEYRPLGSEQVHRSDVRVLCATNQDLTELMKAGRFREDLYYRLHVLTVKVPPLRQREGDVALLVRHFLDKFSKQYRSGAREVHPETLAWMERYPWPGNVRELENRVHRMFVLTTGPVICVPEDAGGHQAPEQTGHPFDRHLGQRLTQAKSTLLVEFERAYLQRLMAASGGNVSLAARRAGKERRALGRLLKKHGMNRPDVRPQQEN